MVANANVTVVVAAAAVSGSGDSGGGVNAIEGDCRRQQCSGRNGAIAGAERWWWLRFITVAAAAAVAAVTQSSSYTINTLAATILSQDLQCVELVGVYANPQH